MAQLKSGSTIGGTGVLLNEANSVTASNITDGVVTVAKLAGVGTAGQVLTSTGGSTAPSMQDLSVDSSNLKSDFTVETGKTTTAGYVVNFNAGKVGNNPIPNPQTDMVTDGAYDYHLANETGTIVLRAETSGSYHQVRTGVVNTSTGAISWNSPVTVYDNQSSSSTELVYLDSNRFLMKGNAAVSGSTAYGYMTCFSVNPTTGSVTYGSTSTISYSGGDGNPRQAQFGGFAPLKDGSSMNKYAAHSHTRGHSGGWTGSSSYYVYTYSDSGSISSTSTDSGTDTGRRWYSVGSNTMINTQSSTNWKKASWNGTTLSSLSDITFDLAYSREMFEYRPSDSVDRFVCLFVTTSNELVLRTYAYSSGSISQISSHTVVEAAAGVTVGGIAGSGDNIIIGYENNSKGYVASFTLDSTTKSISGVGIASKHNDLNLAPSPKGPSSTNKYTVLNNNSASRVINRILTANAYSTVPLSWIGVAAASATAGQSVSVIIDGIAAGFSGLTEGTAYYYDTTAYSGAVTATVTEYLIGTAKSSTEIKLNA